MLDNIERWEELCEQAETEQDPYKLKELLNEIFRLLEQNEARLKAGEPEF
jgi:hypothetical protein